MPDLILAGCPKTGKTRHALIIAMGYALAKQPVLFINDQEPLTRLADLVLKLAPTELNPDLLYPYITFSNGKFVPTDEYSLYILDIVYENTLENIRIPTNQLVLRTQTVNKGVSCDDSIQRLKFRGHS